MKVFHIMPNDAIVDGRIINLYQPTSVTELTSEQVDLFYKNPLPAGKRRKPGTLELEDIPQPSTEELSQQAKSSRDAAISENITVFDCEWQVSNDAADIRKVIQDAEVTNASENDSVMFRLADNSWRKTTLSELKQVLSAQVERKRTIWVKFGEWDAGDKSEPFEV